MGHVTCGICGEVLSTDCERSTEYPELGLVHEECLTDPGERCNICGQLLAVPVGGEVVDDVYWGMSHKACLSRKGTVDRTYVLFEPTKEDFERAYKAFTGNAVLEGRADKLFRTIGTAAEGSTGFGVVEVSWRRADSRTMVTMSGIPDQPHDILVTFKGDEIADVFADRRLTVHFQNEDEGLLEFNATVLPAAELQRRIADEVESISEGISGSDDA